MKIAINAVRVSRQGGGGIDHYVIHLVNRLARLGADFDLYTLSPEHFHDVDPARIIRPFSFSTKTTRPALLRASRPAGRNSSLRSQAARLLGDPLKMAWTQGAFPFHLSARKYDLLFSPSQLDATLFPPPGLKQVVAVLDLIPFILTDQKHKHQCYLKYGLPYALRRSARVITISENTKKDVVRFFGIAEDKITPVLLAKPEFGVQAGQPSELEVKDWKARLGLERYLLCVSGNHPHKNLERLIDAFSVIADRTDVRLAIAGYQDPSLQPALERRVKERGLAGRALFLGHVGAADLPPLYCGADAFVFPSLYEGFGLPPLEALSYGVPVLVSRCSSLPEVVGQAGLYFDPLRADDLAAKLLQILTDAPLRERLKLAGPVQAAKFSWDRTARETLAVFERATARPA